MVDQKGAEADRHDEDFDLVTVFERLPQAEQDEVMVRFTEVYYGPEDLGDVKAIAKAMRERPDWETELEKVKGKSEEELLAEDLANGRVVFWGNLPQMNNGINDEAEVAQFNAMEEQLGRHGYVMGGPLVHGVIGDMYSSTEYGVYAKVDTPVTEQP